MTEERQETERFVGIEEAAEHLHVKRSWLYEQVRLGRVPSYKVGAFRRFKLTELEAWASARRTGPQPVRSVGGDDGRDR